MALLQNYSINCRLTFLFCFLGLLSIPYITVGESSSSILMAVAADGPEANSPVSETAARATYFLIFDEMATLREAVKNPFVQTGGGAGPKTAAFLAEKKVSILIGPKFGHKMKTALASYNIKAVKKQGPAVDAVKEQNNAQR